MPRPEGSGRKPLDRDALHALLFKRADGSGRLRVNISALSEELCCSRKTLHYALNDLKDQGRVSKITRKERTPIGLWHITDPDVVRWNAEGPQSEN